MESHTPCRFAAFLVVALAAPLGQTTLLATESPQPSHAAKPLVDKTLVVWVYPENTSQRGGSVLTLIDKAEHFDAIVLGEIAQGKWMAGSDFFRRTHQDQAIWPAETAGPDALVQLAITYQGNRVTLFRNGKEYAAYTIGAAQSFGDDAMVLLGLRCIGGMGEIGFFSGAIEDARIYNVALSAEQIAALAPKRLSDPPPLAWWKFADGRAEDVMKTFPATRLVGNARIADGKLILDGSSYLWAARDAKLLSADDELDAPFDNRVQTMFYKARSPRTGNMWDTWLFLHQGEYYLYYLANARGGWDNISMARSPDGVHWTEIGRVLAKGRGVTWMGTGSTWKSPNFNKDGKFFMNFSEWKGPRQTIFFAESKDLIHWTRLGNELEFVQDERWYERNGRWDCIWTIPRPGGGLYGYWSATPKAETGGRFGFGETLDGITWKALPPPKVSGVGGGEVGAIERIGDKYYMMFGTHPTMVTLVADRPEGPFVAAKKNFCLLAGHTHIWFFRFFPTPDGVLVNHHSIARDGQVYFGTLKSALLDDAGTLRLGWWKGNDKLKHLAVDVKPPSPLPGETQKIAMIETLFDASRGLVLEGTLKLPAGKEPQPVGLYLAQDNDTGTAILVQAGGVAEFGPMRANGTGFKAEYRVDREWKFGATAQFRLLLKGSLIEFYLDDLLIDCYSLPQPASGRLGILSGGNAAAVEKLQAWLPAHAVSGQPVAGSPLMAADNDKTLVSWVTLDNTTQQGGSALTLQSGNQFDGIVFGEVAPGKWMAGSDNLARTQRDQQANALEKADNKTLVQMAAVYKGNRISIYRNGELYVSYEADNIDLLTAKDNMAVFGLRHQGATGQTLLGSIEDTRIYSKALTADEIKKLEPNKESAVKPYAWWTFEKGQETDRMGRFPVNSLSNGAKIEDGRLVLGVDGAALIASAKPVEVRPNPGAGTPATAANPPLNYHAEGMYHWDTWFLPLGDSVHMYHLQVKRPGSQRPNADHEAIGHAISEDLLHWREQPVALRKGRRGSYDDGCLFTAYAVEHEGTIYLYYCSNHHENGRGRQGICLATSKDGGRTYEKYAGNPIIEPDPKRYYAISEPPPPFGHHAHPHIDCRDLAIVKDPAGNGWLGYVVMRRKGQQDAFHSACIALCRSKDLVRWEIGDPVCTPNRFNCFEVPDVFKLGDKWYMIALTGDVYGQSQRWSDPEITCATVVFEADQPEGPFEEVKDNLLLASKKNVWQGFSARTVLRQDERLMFFTRCEGINGRGSLSWPVKLVPRKEGGLNPVYWSGCDAAFGPAMPLPREGRPQVQRGFMATATVELNGARAGGIAFGDYQALIDLSGRVVLADTAGKPLSDRRWAVRPDRTYKVRIVVTEGMLVIYVDDVLAMDYYLARLGDGGISLVNRGGNVRFLEASYRAVRTGP